MRQKDLSSDTVHKFTDVLFPAFSSLASLLFFGNEQQYKQRSQSQQPYTRKYAKAPCYKAYDTRQGHLKWRSQPDHCSYRAGTPWVSSIGSRFSNRIPASRTKADHKEREGCEPDHMYTEKANHTNQGQSCHPEQEMLRFDVLQKSTQ